MALQVHATKKNYNILTITVPMATKDGRMVTYIKVFSSIKLLDTLIR